MNPSIQELTSISFNAHLIHLLGRIEGKGRSYGFYTAASLMLTLQSEPGSDEHDEAFISFISRGFKGDQVRGAVEAKNLYCSIYERLLRRFEGYSSYSWIKKL